MTTALLVVIALGVIYLCLNQPIPAAGQRRSFLQQAMYHWDKRRHRKWRER